MTSEVLVTGAGGFLGSHCVQQLLAAGYSVRGTVRDPKNESKIRPLMQLDGSERLEIVKADLEKADDWPSVVNGCTYILHTASPFPLGGDESIIKTAVDGSLNVLKAASKDAHVKKVVLTSSCAAVSFGHPRDRIFSETDWTNLDSDELTNYVRSKTLAEKASWDFIKSLPDTSQLKLTVLNPCFIVGPVLVEEQGTSVTVVAELLSGVTEEEQQFKRKINHFAYVDVRDVARAHVLAMTNERSDGERIILVADGLWQPEAARAIEKEFAPQGYEIPTARGTIPSNADELTFKYDTAKARDVLGMTFIKPEQSLVDMCYTLIERGMVPRKPGYKPRAH